MTKMTKSKKDRRGIKPETPKLAASSRELKLDLGCGQNVREGFEGVDLYGDKAKHKVDLFKFPWPFKDGSVDEINCSHFMEHIPAREIEEKESRLGPRRRHQRARKERACERFLRPGHVLRLPR